MDKLYLAIELDDDGNVNDSGRPALTPQAAWSMVENVFNPDSTVIAVVIPTFSVKLPKRIKATFPLLRRRYS